MLKYASHSFEAEREKNQRKGNQPNDDMVWAVWSSFNSSLFPSKKAFRSSPMINVSYRYKEPAAFSLPACAS